MKTPKPSSADHIQNQTPTPAEIAALYRRLDEEAEASGYHLNPDADFTKDLVEGLLVNEKRYGYWNCPCRLSSGSRAADLDIICPCDYRDADIAQYGACFCALYVNDQIKAGKQKARSIPERRPKNRPVVQSGQAPQSLSEGKPGASTALSAPLSLPVWRCKVCGYLCGREGPPEKCPICKASKDRFERFI
jgi:ferredoxin-thioredoxin reductase catalytic subunit